MVRRVRPISNEEGQKLARICRHPTDAYELHRAMVILQSAQGFTPLYIAEMVGYSPDWVRTLLREFNLHEFKMHKPNWKAGGSWKFTQEQKDQLVALATSWPRDLGRPCSQWSLARLRDEAPANSLQNGLAGFRKRESTLSKSTHVPDIERLVHQLVSRSCFDRPPCSTRRRLPALGGFPDRRNRC
jgi:hypothetical protein